MSAMTATFGRVRRWFLGEVEGQQVKSIDFNNWRLDTPSFHFEFMFTFVSYVLVALVVVCGDDLDLTSKYVLLDKIGVGIFRNLQLPCSALFCDIEMCCAFTAFCCHAMHRLI